ncbi:MAG: hypothetical protein QOH63_1924 [Acidobacteriota bacterium]|jgi:excisionase family DNA binding protein|nr:hypothetical protein [Acidobacteriota bacterium]
MSELLNEKLLEQKMRAIAEEVYRESAFIHPPAPVAKKLLTAQEVSEITGWHINHIYRLIRQNRLPKVPNLGRVVRFDPEVIEKIKENGLQDLAA